MVMREPPNGTVIVPRNVCNRVRGCFFSRQRNPDRGCTKRRTIPFETMTVTKQQFLTGGKDAGRGIADTSKLDILAPMIDGCRALGVLAAHPIRRTTL